MSGYELVPAILALTVPFITIVLVLYYYFKTRNSERLALIKSENIEFKTVSLKEMKLKSLSRGILFLSIGVGVAVAMIFSSFVSSSYVFGVYATSILVFGGLGQLIFYNISNKKHDA